MTADQILKELEELADRSGITIRYEKGDFDGGYCVLKAERMIVVNRKLAPTKKGSVVAQAIAEVGVDEVYLKPVVREFIEEELSKAAQEALRAAGVAARASAPASGTTMAEGDAAPETPSVETAVEEMPPAGLTAHAGPAPEAPPEPPTEGDLPRDESAT